jgi:transcriptional regulator with XRE-family HTH domain
MEPGLDGSDGSGALVRGMPPVVTGGCPQAQPKESRPLLDTVSWSATIQLWANSNRECLDNGLRFNMPPVIGSGARLIGPVDDITSLVISSKIEVMTGMQLATERRRRSWSQQKAAARLGVSQPYLSLLEKGERPVTEKLARKAARLYGLSPVSLPLKSAAEALPFVGQDELVVDLAALGYPGFSHLKQPHRLKGPGAKNPADVLASALQSGNLDSRLTEALPWVLLEFPELNWQWLRTAAKLADVQNKLGFITSLARRVAGARGEIDKVNLLAQQESILEQSRLAREDTLCHDSLTQAERNWLRNHRSGEAEHWGLLTDLAPEHLSYADRQHP